MGNSTFLQHLKLNLLSEKQYSSITKNENELYLTPEDNSFKNVVVSNVDPSTVSGLSPGTIYIYVPDLS